ncbi:MAG: alkaline phosphatase family protein [Nitrososphaerota archaeon]
MVTFPSETNWTLPKYESYCISNLIGSISSLLGLNTTQKKLPEDVFDGLSLDGVENVVLFVFDGFGFREWERQRNQGFFGALDKNGKTTPITTVFPSTTSTALTSLVTGLTPQQHSLIEWYLYVSELDMVIQTLPFSPIGAKGSDLLLPIADPKILFEGEPIFSILSREDVNSFSILSKYIANSSYSKLVHGKSKVRAYESLSDMPVVLRRTLESLRGPSFIYAYWSGIDSIEHTYGPSTEETSSEASLVSYSLMKNLVDKLDAKVSEHTLFIVTADHGHISNSPKNINYLNQFSELLSSLAKSSAGKIIPPWGAPRDVYIDVMKEHVESILDFLSQKLSSTARVVRSEEAFRAGLFGSGRVGKHFIERVGKLMILPKDNNLVWYRFDGVDYPPLEGHHGGLHNDEMTVPLSIAKARSLQV